MCAHASTLKKRWLDPYSTDEGVVTCSAEEKGAECGAEPKDAEGNYKEYYCPYGSNSVFSGTLS